MIQQSKARPQYFANKFCRLLYESAAAQELGPEVCWLLVVVVMKLDEIKYSRPAVTFWNEQLMPLCGFKSKERLVTARNKAVSSGWLIYAPGNRITAGLYQVTVPKDLEHLLPRDCRSETEHQNGVCRSEIERQTDFAVRKSNGKPDGKPTTSIPNPLLKKNIGTFERPQEVTEQVWNDWLTVRKSKRSGPVTPTVWAAIEREAKKAGLPIAEAVRIAAERGWITFRADWITVNTRPGVAKGQSDYPMIGKEAIP